MQGTTRFHCHYSGRVQGVGFRYTAKNIAMQHAVSGHVRNLPDGRVELIIEGAKSEVDQVLECIARKMADFIRKFDITQIPATGEMDHFAIKH